MKEFGKFAHFVLRHDPDLAAAAGVIASAYAALAYGLYKAAQLI